MALLTIIVPCFENEANLSDGFTRFLEAEASLPTGIRVEYVFVDDGSRDGTFAALAAIRSAHPDRTTVIKLARNVGIYNALMAGFERAQGDCITVFPADLQEPLELIPRMLVHWKAGCKLVISMREGRTDGVLARLGSWAFHRLLRGVSMRELPVGGYGTALFDRRVMLELLRIGEKNTNTLLLLTMLGYDYVVVPYVRRERLAGRSGWTLTKKIKLFIDSFVAFSFFPIRLITFGGLVLGVLALGYGCVVLFAALTGSIPVQGWSALMLVTLLVSSFQMIALGVLGEYVWRTLDTVRRRPTYVVDTVLDERVRVAASTEG